MGDKWIETLLEGSLEIRLPRLALVQGTEHRFVGSGRIFWDSKTIRIQAETDGGCTLLSAFGDSVPPGTLLPHDSYIAVEGETQEGGTVTTVPVPKDGCRMRHGSSIVVWDFTTHSVSLSQHFPGNAPERRILRGLFSPGPSLWTRRTTTLVENPFFGSQGWARDWFQAESSVGTIAARSQPGNSFEVFVRIEGADERPPIDILRAIGRAVGFSLGQLVSVRGFKEVFGTKETCTLRSPIPIPTRNTLLPPLHEECGQSYEPYLSKAIDFFLSDLGKKVGDHLSLCWDVQDNTITTRRTVKCVCLEGILRLLSSETNYDPGFTQQDKDLLAGWFADTPGLSPRFISRLNGFVGSMHHPRPQDILEGWRQKGHLRVTKEDIDAFTRTRNPAAHGSLIGKKGSRGQVQAAANDDTRITHLLNRIVLHLMGYTGKYVDYTTPTWSAADFPPTRPTTDRPPT